MADFDEYEYLEKAVDGDKAGGPSNGREEDRARYGHDAEEEEEEERRVRRRSRSNEPRERERERSREPRERERDDGEHRDRGDRGGDRGDYRGRDREYRGRDKDFRGRHRDYDRRGDRDYHRGRRKEEKEEPEADPERDQRTVFAYQINLKADERDVYEFFSRAGKVRDVRLIMDRNSRRSKGVGYIEFYDAMSVPMAIALRGQLLLGTPVMVKPSEAEKNLAAQAAAAAAAAATLPTGALGAGLPGASLLLPSLAGSKRLHINNLHVNMNEDQLKQVVEPFGALESVQVPTDPATGQCKGFGFVTYAKLEDAKIAQQYLNDMEVAGLKIKVTPIPETFNLPGMGDGGPHVNPGELDDDEGGGLSLNAQSRVALMQKLDRGAAAGLLASNPLAGLPGAAGLPGLTATGLPGAASLPGLAGLANPLATAAVVENIGTPSQNLLLKNMFTSGEEVDDEFAQDIREDVEAECVKFGKVLLVHVDRHSLISFVHKKTARQGRFEQIYRVVQGFGPVCCRDGRGSWGKGICAGPLVLSFFSSLFTFIRSFPCSYAASVEQVGVRLMCC